MMRAVFYIGLVALASGFIHGAVELWVPKREPKGWKKNDTGNGAFTSWTIYGAKPIGEGWIPFYQ